MLDSNVLEAILVLVLLALAAVRPNFLAPAGRALLGALERLARRPRRGLTVLAVATATGAALIAGLCGLPVPFFHDEHVYLLAADTFAHGRLTNPPHSQWQHFETFHVLQQPTYAAKYPPVQGLILAVGQVLGHPAVGLWLSAGLLVLAVGWALYAWLPVPWALAGAAFVGLRLGVGSYWSQSYWGGTAAALGGALLYGALRRVAVFASEDDEWRPPRARDGAVMGLGLAILANSRPLEGFAISLPAAAVLGVWAWRTWIWPPDGRKRPPFGPLMVGFLLPILTVLALAAGTMGFYNLRVTGEPLVMPYSLHEEVYSRMRLFVWQEPRPEVEYRHEVIARMHEGALGVYRPGARWVGPLELWRRVATHWRSVLGGGAVVLMVLLGRRVLADPWMRFAVAAWAVLPAVHAVTHSYRQHYDAPGLILLIALVASAGRGLVEGAGARNGGSRYRSRAFAWSVVAAFGVLQLVHLGLDLPCRAADPRRFERVQVLETLRSTPGRDLVLVRYGEAHVPQWEWVYNGADLDGAEIVWARDMGPAANRPLLEHYTGRRAWILVVDDPDLNGPQLRPYPLEPP